MVLPIRLIRKDLEVINLDCTDYMMTVKRNIFVQPIPITGERLGGDLNMNTAAIRFECIIRDDEDCGKQIISDNKKATALIDFSSGAQAGLLNSMVVFGVYMSGDSVDGEDGPVSASDLNGSRIEIQSSDGTLFNIDLDSNSTSTSPPQSGYTISVGIQSANSAETIVSRIYDTLNAYTLFTAKIEVEKVVGTNPITEAGVEGALKFTQVVAGPNGHTGTPRITTSSTSSIGPPSIQPFSGGRDGNCFSAGDKVQNLLGNVVSNSVLGALGGMYNLADLGFPEGDIGYNSNDYIIGVQIPYNSLVNSDTQTAVNGVPEGYAARNFIFGTGFGNKDKDALSNVELASKQFEITDRRSGIRGTVLECEVNYEAGDTIYRATITFQPLDVIAGI